MRAPDDAASLVETGPMFEFAEDVEPDELSARSWLAVVEIGLDALRAVGAADDAVNRLLRDAQGADTPGVTPTAVERREATWTEFLRETNVSFDRLLVFLRLLAGSLGEDIQELLVHDEEHAKATKQLNEQRLAVVKRVSDVHAKLVETLMAGMLRDSKLTLTRDPLGALICVDQEMRSELRDLARGESGRPFFESSVALRNLAEVDAKQAMPFGRVVESINDVAFKLKGSLLATLTSAEGIGASIDELTKPRNSYSIALKHEVVAIIRSSHDRIANELASRGRRPLLLYELVEGGSSTLSQRVAEFVATMLQLQRASSGVSAAYVGAHAQARLAALLRVSLARVVHAAEAYLQRVPEQPSHAGGRVRASREELLERAQQVGVVVAPARGGGRRWGM